MPDYKRKHRSRFKTAPKIDKKRIKKEPSRDIVMTSHGETATRKTNMRVVSGKKLEQRRKFKIVSIFFAVVIAVVTIIQLSTPAGILESTSNYFALFGSGSYPIELESNDTINTVSKGNYYYVLTDTRINAFSSNGNIVFSHAHGFENPVLKTSATRALVFDQGANKGLIFNLNGIKSTISLEEKIINAAIADNGTYALVTTTDSYAAAVSVYKKNGKQVYEWFSSKDLVNNVAVSPTGKKVAVSTLNTDLGQYNSKVLVLNFKSATPEFQKEYQNTAVFAFDTTSRKGFSVVTFNDFNYISWSNFKIREYKNEYNIVMFRATKNGIVLVCNRENDKTDNRIVVLTSKGKLKKELKFKGIITDISLHNGQVYCISDTKAYILNDNGVAIRGADCGFGVVRMAILGQNTIAAITDNTIDKVKLKQE